MPLFYNHNKPGKGIDENAPPKRRFFLFFELFFRKFGKLIQLNLLYLAAIIPNFILLFFIGSIILAPFYEYLGTQFSEYGDIFFFWFLLNSLFAVILICLWGAGPATAGLIYIARNISREKHAWILSDFLEHTRKNFKQAIVVFIVDLVAICMFFVAFSFYFDRSAHGDALSFFAFILMLVFFVIYTIMHLYIYPMMVTFKLPLKALYKNALIFALARLPQNILIVAAIIAVLFAATSALPLSLMLSAFILLFSLCGYISVFWTYPTLQKYMIKSEEKVKQDYEI